MMGPLFEDDSGQGDIHLRISVMTVLLSTRGVAFRGRDQRPGPGDAGIETRPGGSPALRINALNGAERM